LPARHRETDPAVQPVAPPKKNKKVQGNSPQFALDKELQRITGVDFTRIPSAVKSPYPPICSDVDQKSGSWKLWITRLYSGILKSEAQKRPFGH